MRDYVNHVPLLKYHQSLLLHSQKSKKGSKGDSAKMHRSASAEAIDKQPQSELLAGELEKQNSASISRSFGQKMLFDALGARESSMVTEAQFCTEP